MSSKVIQAVLAILLCTVVSMCSFLFTKEDLLVDLHVSSGFSRGNNATAKTTRVPQKDSPSSGGNSTFQEPVGMNATATMIISEADSSSSGGNSTFQQLVGRKTLEVDQSTNECDIIRRTRLYSPECNNTGKGVPRRLLITSTGRSGTEFLELLLRKVGLGIGHDDKKIPLSEAPHGSVSWAHAFNNNVCVYPPWAWRRRRRNLASKDKRNFLHIVHIVRDPLMSIRSRWNLGTIFHFSEPGRCNTAQDDFPGSIGSTKDTTLRETLRHWVLWNTFIESYTPTRFRTEDLSGDLVHRLYSIAHQDTPMGEDPLPPVKKTVLEIDKILGTRAISSHSSHTKKPSYNMTWDMLDKLDHEYVVMAQLMAIRYNYEVDEQLAIQNRLDQQKQVCGFKHDQRWSCRLEPITES